MPNDSAAPADPSDTLAHAHDARTLAAALVKRLRAEGREDAAEAVRAALAIADPGGMIDPNPPNPGGRAGT